MERTRTVFDIRPRTFVYAGLAIAFAYACWQLRSVFLLIAVALLISVFVEAAVLKLERVKIPRIAGVVLVYVTGLVIIFGLLYLLIPIFLEELISIAGLFPQNDLLASIGAVFQNISSVKSSLGHSEAPLQAINAIRSSLTTSGIVSSFSQIFGGLVNFGVLMVMSFYFSIQHKSVDQFLTILTPHNYEERVLGIWRRSKVRIMAWFRGQLLSASILAVATYIGLLIMGVPYALLLSITALVFSLIPYGIVIATIPAAVVATLGGGVTLGLLVMGYYALLQQLENYVLQPVIMRSVTGVPSLIVLISAIVGVTLIGFFGLVLALPACIVIIECMNEYDRQQVLTLEKREHNV